MDDTNKPTEGKVSIACKLPAGLMIRHGERTLTLNGSNSDGAIAGFGITKNVDADWFNDWADKSKHPAVLNGAIFANTSAKVGGEAKETSGDVKTGLEPLDGEKPMKGIERVPTIGG